MSVDGAELVEQSAEGGPLNIGLLCFIVSRAMEDRVLSDLAAAGFDDVTVAQGRVFARIGPKGTRLTDLAEQARVTKQTAGFLVDQLERAGYVRRVPDPTDARARLVVIAERGAAAVDVARRTEAAVQAEWTRYLGRRATVQLYRTLSRLREITDPYG
jgi:DNA-binding MarR family transcriptional regulator